MFELLALFARPLATAGWLGALASVATAALLATTNAMLSGAGRQASELVIFSLLCLAWMSGVEIALPVRMARAHVFPG